MLYHLYEMQRAALAPARFAVDQTRALIRHPLNPVANLPTTRALAAGFELFEHTTRRYGKPHFDIASTMVDGREVAVEEDVVQRTEFCELRHFARNGVAPGRHPRLLVVAPMSGHFATLLRGTVRAMAPDHEVYITDWIDAREVPLARGTFDLDDYIDTLIGFLEYLGPGTHVMAVCQPSVPVLAAVSLMAMDDHPCAPASMILMGGPIDTRVNPTKVNTYAESAPLAWFERNVIMRVPWPNRGAMRRVYPGFLQLAGFMSMNLERHIDAHHDIFCHLVQGDGESAQAKQAFYEEYRSVMDLTAEFYLQTVVTVFQEHALPKGEMVSRGRAIEPAAITKTALMTVEGEHDDISGVGQTRAAHSLCTGLMKTLRLHYEQKGVGHYGIFNGGCWRDEIAPRVKAFIAQQTR
ncbi:MAG: polyhydroxyalkanoate depolymerase [Alphaproteobacteria bacterium]|nr:polyhydroxyalkanoate depolymerase [Alphaproteobacteria bacterium]